MSHRPPVSKFLACIIFALAAMSASALAEPPPAVNVVIRDQPPPRRIVAIEYNPLYLLIDKLSATIVVAPISHHALVVSPSYVFTETAPVYIFASADNQTQLPRQKFTGFGGELGYRYYVGERGPRGFFFGPSVILAFLTAKAQNGDRTRFRNYGLAADVGYQALIADRVALSFGAGLQYTKNNTPIPNQQFPANFSANGGIRPRLLLSLGWAF
jgi:hypothetical protein